MSAIGRPFDWTDFLGPHQTIAIHVPVLNWTGDYHAAALFEELVWRWNVSGRQTFTVSDADLMAKLHMTRGAVRGARAKLVELKAVGTTKKGIPPVLHYTVDPYVMRVEPEPTLGEFRTNDGADSAQPQANSGPTFNQSRSDSKAVRGDTAAAPDGGAAPNDDLAPADGPEPHAADRPPPPGGGLALPPRRTDRWLDLKRIVALDIAGDPDAWQYAKDPSKCQRFVGAIVGHAGGLVGNDPEDAAQVWFKFFESLTPAQRVERLTRKSALDWFRRWTVGPGAEWIRQYLEYARNERAKAAHQALLYRNTVEVFGVEVARDNCQLPPLTGDELAAEIAYWTREFPDAIWLDPPAEAQG